MNYELKYMSRCIQLARQGEAGAPPNPMVGAVVVCDGRILGEGYHRRCGGPHAEVNAIASVRDRHLLPESTIYVSLEPCNHYGKTPPCTELIIRSGIRRVVVGCTDPFQKVNGQGIRRLREAGCEVVTGVMEEECRHLNRRFFTFHQQHRPYVTLKWAQSSDGYMGLNAATTPPVRFSNDVTQTLVHRLRARSGAILVGTRTALADNPSLTTRLWPGPSPLRLTIDRHGALPPTLRLLDGSVPTVVYQHESLREIMDDLYQRGIQTLLVEGGARLLQSFIDEELWDEARIETAPFCLGRGVCSPTLRDATLLSEHRYFGNSIRRYVRSH